MFKPLRACTRQVGTVRVGTRVAVDAAADAETITAVPPRQSRKPPITTHSLRAEERKTILLRLLGRVVVAKLACATVAPMMHDHHRRGPSSYGRHPQREASPLAVNEQSVILADAATAHEDWRCSPVVLGEESVRKAREPREGPGSVSDRAKACFHSMLTSRLTSVFTAGRLHYSAYRVPDIIEQQAAKNDNAVLYESKCWTQHKASTNLGGGTHAGGGSAAPIPPTTRPPADEVCGRLAGAAIARSIAQAYASRLGRPESLGCVGRRRGFRLARMDDVLA